MRGDTYTAYDASYEITDPAFVPGTAEHNEYVVAKILNERAYAREDAPDTYSPGADTYALMDAAEALYEKEHYPHGWSDSE